MYTEYDYNNELCHHGIKGQKWGLRRYQHEDGSVTPAGAERYYVNGGREERLSKKSYALKAKAEKELEKTGTNRYSRKAVHLTKKAKHVDEDDKQKYIKKALRNEKKSYKVADRHRQAAERDLNKAKAIDKKIEESRKPLQNVDGSLTKKGLKEYSKVEDRLRSIDNVNEKLKTKASKYDSKAASTSNEQKAAKLQEKANKARSEIENNKAVKEYLKKPFKEVSSVQTDYMAIQDYITKLDKSISKHEAKIGGLDKEYRNTSINAYRTTDKKLDNMVKAFDAKQQAAKDIKKKDRTGKYVY